MPDRDRPPIENALRVTFLDVETTGLFGTDRIVSLGMISTNILGASRDAHDGLDLHHFIFDPGIKSHPGAEAVHGYDDWVLRHQPPFETVARHIHETVHQSHLIVAHNAEFDVGFLNREFVTGGYAKLSRPTYCTMDRWRKMRGGTGKLDMVIGRLKLSRSGTRHGALEDAYLAMRVYFHLNKIRSAVPFAGIARGPSNWIEPPPRPQGSLPPRTRTKGPP